MNLDHMRHFLEVARVGNISAAAKKLRLTQPALSRQMAVFENDTGRIHINNDSITLSHYSHARILGDDPLNPCPDKGGFTDQKWYSLALHVRTH